MSKKFAVIAALGAFALGGFAVSQQAVSATDAKKVIVFGATVGDFSDIVQESLKPQLEAQGYTVELVQFTDYVQPNIALAEGRLDVNIFQHKPYLDQFAKQKGLNLSPVAEVPTAPLGLYAGKKAALTEVADGSTVAVPNDPTNLSRSLRILQDLGWIQLAPNADLFTASTKDIASNPKHIQIVQLEAAQIPRALADVDFAVINGNYVVSSGLKISSALAREKSNDYLNWAVVRASDADSATTKAVVASLHSPEFHAYAERKFAGYKFPAGWTKQ